MAHLPPLPGTPLYDEVGGRGRSSSPWRPGDRPFGVDYRCDAHAAQAVAAVSGASFIREVFPWTKSGRRPSWARCAQGERACKARAMNTAAAILIGLFL